MRSLTRQFVLLLLAALIPAAGVAQNLPVSRIDLRTPPVHIRIPTRLPELLPARSRKDDQKSPGRQTAGRTNRPALGWGIAIGIGAGAAVAGIAAAKYGGNEGGTFCGRCAAEWSAIAIPIGAGAGAAVGYLIDRAHR